MQRLQQARCALRPVQSRAGTAHCAMAAALCLHPSLLQLQPGLWRRHGHLPYIMVAAPLSPDHILLWLKPPLHQSQQAFAAATAGNPGPRQISVLACPKPPPVAGGPCQAPHNQKHMSHRCQPHQHQSALPQSGSWKPFTVRGTRTLLGAPPLMLARRRALPRPPLQPLPSG